MALDSTSTITDANAQLSNNLAWNGNPTKAADALEAVRWLMIHRPTSAGDGDGQNYTYEALAEMEKKLDKYVNSTSTTVAARRSSFTQAKMTI